MEKKAAGFTLFYMIICGIDVETTGLDPAKDEICEIARAIFDSENMQKPLRLRHFYLKATVPDEIAQIHKMTTEFLENVSTPIEDVFNALNTDLLYFGVTYFVAHNAPFDRLFLETALFKNGTGVPSGLEGWIDTQRDIEFPKAIRHRELTYLCAHHGFLNPFPHSALFDVMSMMRILSAYALPAIIAYKNEPTVYLRALVDFHSRDLAKARGFRWEEWEGKKHPKTWVKAVKQKYVEEEKRAANFTIEEIR